MSAINDLLKAELKEYGRWARATGTGQSARSVLDIEEREGQEFFISDERAMDIDRIIALLRVRDPDGAKVLKSVYVQQMSLRDVAKHYQINKDKVSKILDMAVACVGMGLDMTAANDENF